MNNFPILSVIILLPLITAAVVPLLNVNSGRLFALFSFVINLALSIFVVIQFDSANPAFQMVDSAVWISSLNINYAVGVDGISVLFLPLANILFIAVVLSSWTSIKKQSNLYYSMLLWLASASIGIFVAIDTITFFLFWESTLIPIYFLISLWGIGPNRRFAASQYSLFMLLGGLPILLGFVLLAVSGSGDAYIFSYPELIKQNLSSDTQIIIFLLLLVGFGIKTPIFPFHSWLPMVAMEGPAGVAAIMTGLKLGAYGILRFAIPLAPDAAQTFHWLLAGIGIMGVLYGAILALRQTNLRKVLAYSSISHVGLVVLGLASLSLQGIQGAVFQLLNFTLIASILFIMAGFIQHRVGSTDIATLGGLSKKMPLLTAFFLLFGLASMGVPGTSGFPAEFLIIVAALKSHLGAGLAALVAIIIGASYFLRIYQKTFLGAIKSDVLNEVMDLRKRELMIVLSFAVIVIAVGLYPEWLLNIISSSSEAWLANIK